MPVQADAALPAWTLPGEVQARYSTPLSFRVGGKIVERLVRLGDAVTPGQIVARLDPADAAKNAASARAQLSAAQHQLDYAKQLDRDRAQARENLIAATQLEQTRNAYASALAQRDQAAQQSALAADQLKYTTLQADHAGVITAERADTGQNVSAGQAVTTWPGRATSTPSATCPKACWPAWRWASAPASRSVRCPARLSTPCCARSRPPPTRRAAPTAPSSRWKIPSPRSAWA